MDNKKRSSVSKIKNETKIKDSQKKEIVSKEEFVSFVQKTSKERENFNSSPLSKDFDFCFIFCSLYLGHNQIKKITTKDTTIFQMESFDKTQIFTMLVKDNNISFETKTDDFGPYYFSEHTFDGKFCERKCSIKYFPLGKETRFAENSKIHVKDGIYHSVIIDRTTKSKITSFQTSDIFNISKVVYCYEVFGEITQYRKASSAFKSVPFIEPFGANSLLEIISEHFNEYSDMMVFDDVYYFNNMEKTNKEKYEKEKQAMQSLLNNKKSNVKNETTVEKTSKTKHEKKVSKEKNLESSLENKKFISKRKIALKAENWVFCFFIWLNILFFSILFQLLINK